MIDPPTINSDGIRKRWERYVSDDEYRRAMDRMSEALDILDNELNMKDVWKRTLYWQEGQWAFEALTALSKVCDFKHEIPFEEYE